VYRKFKIYRGPGVDTLGPIYIIYSLRESEQYDKRPFAFDLSKFEVCCLDSADDPYLHYTLAEKLVVIDETSFGMCADF
jgi:hypothetical protein